MYTPPLMIVVRGGVVRGGVTHTQKMEWLNIHNFSGRQTIASKMQYTTIFTFLYIHICMYIYTLIGSLSTSLFIARSFLLPISTTTALVLRNSSKNSTKLAACSNVSYVHMHG